MQADVGNHRRRPETSWQVGQVDDDVLVFGSGLNGADHLHDLGMFVNRIRVSSHGHVPLAIRGSTLRQRTRQGIRETFGYRRRSTGIGD